ncbi:ROK family protein [Paenibacillus sp. TRM 82003]|uniref:ROK family protein n=1 Tax=Kineococcus sp. TRM81007 TaxID=2925831 RepID=UPI001F5AB571|nr:ROK family protein [Kineococcus sp. TRM81007]MCI2239417.1 ROK family protein [Kineococcus sp. TRM81007]MCI3918787.1 ROK family protein [Paenibacillus sp. TRM 82003]
MTTLLTGRGPTAAGGRDGVRVGLDIGGTKIEGVALAPDGTVLAHRRAPSPEGVRAVVDAAAAVVADLTREPPGTGAPTGPGRPPTAVGVGIPGLVDPVAGTVGDAVNLGFGTARVPFGRALSERLGGVPVLVENDVNVSALGARELLAPGGDLALLSLGTGLAAGVVVGGVLLRGARGAAGEIGHLAIDPRGRACPCGQRGCLETVASGAALRRAWPHGDEGRSAEHLFAAAGAGDPAAVAVRDEWAAAVALAVRTLALTCDPERVVLGGGVAAVGAPLREAVAAALRAQATGSAFLRGLAVEDRISLLPPGAPVAAVGAARLGVPAPG